MLKTLRRIVQEVNAAPDLRQALQIMVRRVRRTLLTDACSIYLIDGRRAEFILVATEGLNKKLVGKVRLNISKGLLGLVGRREEPINLSNARLHPAFYFYPGAGEDEYSAFLGVPIIHHRRLLGILTIQQREERRYDQAEEAFLVTISAQLAPVISGAESQGALTDLTGFSQPELSELEDANISGIPSVSGIGIGTAVVVYPPADLSAVPDRHAEDIEQEILSFEHALLATRNEITHLSLRLKDSLPEEEASIFDVYLRMLDSQSLGAEVISKIREGFWAQSALRQVIKKHVRHFESLEDEYLRERAIDFKDLGRRVLVYLQADQIDAVEYAEKTILVGEEITAADLAKVPEGCLVGMVSAGGSSSSHVAILAKALGVPTVMGATGMSISQLAGKSIIVDGYYGQVYVSPTPQLLTEFAQIVAEEQRLNAKLIELRNKPAETTDGHRVSLLVNMGLAVDASLSLSVGAEGVGLYRTEVPFMVRDCFPTEDEQYVVYRQLLQAFAPRPVIMRTLDIGGDKSLPYFPVEEENPFLGWRGIRVTLDHPEVFLVQIRAMLRASKELNNLKIMLPMVSGVGELDEALLLIQQAYRELVEEKESISYPQIGVMIEVPSAVYQAKDFAKRVDFLSVGSNDLTQYLLAVDRNNTRVASLYDPLHPALLQALNQVILAGHSENKPIGICGEMASDPITVILLLAMGFDSLSMNSKSLPKVKWVIRNFTLEHAKRLLAEVLEMDDPTLIRFHLEKSLTEAGLGNIIRAVKR